MGKLGLEFDLVQYSTLFLVIGFAGFVDAIAGGGGLLTIPCYLALGLPQNYILGTNKAVSSLGTTIAVSRYIYTGKVNWKLVLPGLGFAVCGAIFGALASRIQNRESMVGIIILLVPLALYLGRRAAKTAPLESDFVVTPRARQIACVVGFTIGMYDGFFGPCTGTFFLVALVSIFGLSFAEASSNGRILNYASNIGAVLYFGSSGKIYWPVAIVGMVASVVGNWFGSGVVIHRGNIVVKPAFYAVLTLLLGKTLWDIWH